jgi:hypothetical protein
VVVEGLLELIRPFQVRGWAHDPAFQDASLTVSLSVAAEEIATETANVFRDDLFKAGKGDGRHGFVINVDRRLPTETPHLVLVSVTAASGSIEILPTAAGCVEMEPKSTIPGRVPPASPITGYFRITSASEIAGWAYDPRHPDEYLTVEVFAGHQRIGSTVADQFRSDLAAARVGKGDHGFVLRLDHELPIDGVIRLDAFAGSRSGIYGALGFISPGDGSPDAEPAGAPLTRSVGTGTAVAFVGATRDRAHCPVFVLGAARSGTSAIAQALVAATRYMGHEEGHLLDLVGSMLQAVDRHYDERSDEWRYRENTMIAAAPKAFLEDGVRHIFVELARALFPKGWWLDKTPRPAMIRVAPMLREIWPEARFIYMKRRAIENIMSRMTKFPTLDFDNHCRDWTEAMQSWTQVRASLAGAAVEIDQLFLATQPDRVAEALSRLLILQQGEVASLSQALRLDRPERTAERFGAAASLAELPWLPEQRNSFWRICGQMMDAYGYSDDAEYFKEDAASQGLIFV